MRVLIGKTPMGYSTVKLMLQMNGLLSRVVSMDKKEKKDLDKSL